MSYPVDIKTTRLTGTGTIFDGPARVLGFYYVNDNAAGTIVIADGGTTIATFDVPTGATTAVVKTVVFPGTGLYCKTSAKATLTTIDMVTFFYG
jgi:hypothetical protein